MKKLIVLTIAMMMAFTLTACGGNSNSSNIATLLPTPQPETSEPTPTPTPTPTDPPSDENIVDDIDYTPAETFEYEDDPENGGIKIIFFDWRIADDLNRDITDIHIPPQIDGKNVTAIGNGDWSPFGGKEGIKNIIIPDSVTYIGDNAFRQCLNLTSIIIPNSVTEIGDGAFSYCSALTSVTLPSGLKHFSRDLFYECKLLTDITIPAGLETIGASAFAGCRSLTSIHLPDSVTEIGDYAFDWCDNLTDLILPEHLRLPEAEDEIIEFLVGVWSRPDPCGKFYQEFRADGTQSESNDDGLFTAGTYVLSDGMIKLIFPSKNFEIDITFEIISINEIRLGGMTFKRD